MLLPKSTSELISKISTDKIVGELILQLNKDFQLCNIRIEYERDLSPTELHKKLSKDISNLMMNHYDDYLNLLYLFSIFS